MSFEYDELRILKLFFKKSFVASLSYCNFGTLFNKLKQIKHEKNSTINSNIGYYVINLLC
jgi:hypothetical protein